MDLPVSPTYTALAAFIAQHKLAAKAQNQLLDLWLYTQQFVPNLNLQEFLPKAMFLLDSKNPALPSNVMAEALDELERKWSTKDRLRLFSIWNDACDYANAAGTPPLPLTSVVVEKIVSAVENGQMLLPELPKLQAEGKKKAAKAKIKEAESASLLSEPGVIATLDVAGGRQLLVRVFTTQLPNSVIVSAISMHGELLVEVPAENLSPIDKSMEDWKQEYEHTNWDAPVVVRCELPDASQWLEFLQTRDPDDSVPSNAVLREQVYTLADTGLLLRLQLVNAESGLYVRPEVVNTATNMVVQRLPPREYSPLGCYLITDATPPIRVDVGFDGALLVRAKDSHAAQQTAEEAEVVQPE